MESNLLHNVGRATIVQCISSARRGNVFCFLQNDHDTAHYLNILKDQSPVTKLAVFCADMQHLVSMLWNLHGLSPQGSAAAVSKCSHFAITYSWLLNTLEGRSHKRTFCKGGILLESNAQSQWPL